MTKEAISFTHLQLGMIGKLEGEAHMDLRHLRQGGTKADALASVTASVRITASNKPQKKKDAK